MRAAAWCGFLIGRTLRGTEEKQRTLVGHTSASAAADDVDCRAAHSCPEADRPLALARAYYGEGRISTGVLIAEPRPTS
jgi:hypothetical protein